MVNSSIEINFVCGANKKKLFVGAASYRSSSVKTDKLHIYNKVVVIESNRTSVQREPLKQHNSTLYKQIVKAICLYYVMERKPRALLEIAITQNLGNAREHRQAISLPELKQVVSKSANLAVLSAIDPNKAALLLEETSRGRAVLHAVTHLIKSLDSASAFDRFERLWRAFNALYRAFAKKNTEHDCHRALREHIQQYSTLFPLALHLVSPLTAASIRPNVRWNQMILNNYATTAKAAALRDSIIRVMDHRILNIYNDSLPIRQAHLTSIGELSTVQNHIATHIHSGTVRDSDVLSTLCIKYMYFVRNKIAHAERADYGFSFLPGSAEEKEIQWLIPFLEALVIDLLNIADTF